MFCSNTQSTRRQWVNWMVRYRFDRGDLWCWCSLSLVLDRGVAVVVVVEWEEGHRHNWWHCCFCWTLPLDTKHIHWCCCHDQQISMGYAEVFSFQYCCCCCGYKKRYHASFYRHNNCTSPPTMLRWQTKYESRCSMALFIVSVLIYSNCWFIRR